MELRRVLIDAFLRPRMSRYDNRQAVALRHCVQYIYKLVQCLFRVNIFLTMRTDHEKLGLLQFETFQDVRSIYFFLVMRQDFEHWAACLDDSIGGEPPTQKIFTGDRGIGQINFLAVGDYLALYFLLYTL